MNESKQKIVIIGNIFQENLTFHGPFEDTTHANQWIAANASNQITNIVDLE